MTRSVRIGADLLRENGLEPGLPHPILSLSSKSSGVALVERLKRCQPFLVEGMACAVRLHRAAIVHPGARCLHRVVHPDRCARQNAGADRVCSVQSLSKCLGDCLQAFFGEGLASSVNAIREEGVRYELPVPLQQLQTRLQESIGTPNFLESLLNTFSSIVIVLDFEGHILFINHRAELVSGYTFYEFRGRNSVKGEGM
jgi:PAS domain-containing protein